MPVSPRTTALATSPRPRLIAEFKSYSLLLGAQIRASLTVAAAYRFQFILDAVLALFGLTGRVVPLFVALHDRPPIGGWTFDRALVVVGFFTILKGILDGAVNPSLVAVVDHIRTGTLDFLLIKPRDAQFLVCTSKFELWRAVDVPAGVAIIVWAFAREGMAPRPLDVAVSLVLLVAATVLLYSVWLLVVTAAFWVVRLDNLAYMFNALFDFARWPRSVMKGALAVVFTVVLPLAVMTSYPAEALLGALSPSSIAFALALAASFAITARIVFKRALSRYTSASS